MEGGNTFSAPLFFQLSQMETRQNVCRRFATANKASFRLIEIVLTAIQISKYELLCFPLQPKQLL